MRITKIAWIMFATISCYIYPEPCPPNEDIVRTLEEPDDHTLRLFSLEAFLKVFIEPELSSRYALAILSNSIETGIPAGIITGVILRESSADSGAIGPPIRVSSGGYDNAIGLMQVVPYYWEGAFPLCGKNLFNPETNICYGAHILRFYIRETNGDIRQALMRYSGHARRYSSYVYEYIGEYHIYNELGGYINDSLLGPR